MSLDPSLKSASSLVRHRNVLTRGERLEKLADLGKWTDAKSPLGLVKVGNRKQVIAGKEKTEAVAGATPAGLNGEQRVTAVGANTVSWATTVADGAATAGVAAARCTPGPATGGPCRATRARRAAVWQPVWRQPRSRPHPTSAGAGRRGPPPPRPAAVARGWAAVRLRR